MTYTHTGHNFYKYAGVKYHGIELSEYTFLTLSVFVC